MTKIKIAKSLLYKSSKDIMKIEEQELVSLLILLNARECGTILERIKDLMFCVIIVNKLINIIPEIIVSIICNHYISEEKFARMSGCLSKMRKSYLSSLANEKDKQILQRAFAIRLRHF